MIKNACNHNIDIDLKDGWYIDDNEKLAIQYFLGNPYPEDINEIISMDSSDDEDNDDENDCVSESDDSDVCDTEDD